jgi:hypothetical protein
MRVELEWNRQDPVWLTVLVKDLCSDITNCTIVTQPTILKTIIINYYNSWGKYGFPSGLL